MPKRKPGGFMIGGYVEPDSDADSQATSNKKSSFASSAKPKELNKAPRQANNDGATSIKSGSEEDEPVKRRKKIPSNVENLPKSAINESS